MKIKSKSFKFYKWPVTGQLFYFLIWSVANVCAEFVIFSKFERSNTTIELKPIEEVSNSQNPMLVNGVLYKTFKKYYCSPWNNVDTHHTIVHGNEGWTFARQDVNLTLAYPSSVVKKDDNDYLVTGYQVILFTDGSESKAYISSGGLMEDFISFTFICNQITTLSYRFWLYGTERESITARDPVRITC